jgi:hypothetical protein
MPTVLRGNPHGLERIGNEGFANLLALGLNKSPISCPLNRCVIWKGSSNCSVRIWRIWGDFIQADAASLPDHARQLLAHNRHMTVALEAFHASLVRVEVLAVPFQQLRDSLKDFANGGILAHRNP